MSEVYVHEPSTCGKVVLHTSHGDLDIELWCKECPKACRNFVQLCLEGYYDGTIFHRIIKDFLIQGGDPTGSGRGGESIYGEASFPCEFHPRLLFRYRGLVGVANLGESTQTHGSQFFITLGRANFLDRHHTLFGKVSGHTVYNLVRISDLETDSSDRPVHPPVIKSAEVLWNPFNDIIPRNSPAILESDAIRKGKRERESSAIQSKNRPLRKDSLLSFHDRDEDEDSQHSQDQTKRLTDTYLKPIGKSAHDLLDDIHLIKGDDSIYGITKKGTNVSHASIAAKTNDNSPLKPILKSDTAALKDAIKSNIKIISKEMQSKMLEKEFKSNSSLPSLKDLSTSVASTCDDTVAATTGTEETMVDTNDNLNADGFEFLSNAYIGEKMDNLMLDKESARIKKKHHIKVQPLTFKKGQGTSNTLEHEMKAVQDSELLKDSEKRRQVYLLNKRDTSKRQRQQDTMSKLAAFDKKLQTVFISNNNSIKTEEVVENKEVSAAHAPSLDDDNEFYNEDWLKGGGLKFAIDSSRAYELHAANEALEVFDPLKGKSFSKELKNLRNQRMKPSLRRNEQIPKW